MNYQEEQQLELEALEAIFVHENELSVESPSRFLLRLVPFPDEDEENFVGVTLCVTYGELYPEVSPSVEVRDPFGGVGEDLLLRELTQTVIPEVLEENRGAPVVYILAEVVQEWLRKNNQKQLTMHEEMMVREKKRKKLAGNPGTDDEDAEDEDDEDGENGEEENHEWRGLDAKDLVPDAERMTAELFLQWRDDFEEELVRLGLKTVSRTASAISGKEFFLRAKKAAEEAGTGFAYKDEIAEEDVHMDEADLQAAMDRESWHEGDVDDESPVSFV